MSWDAIVGHSRTIAQLRGGLETGRLHHALLFEGPEGVGKRLVALTLVQAHHCPLAESRGGDPCGECRVCSAIMASADPATTQDSQSEHPGVRVVTPSRPDERELRFGGSTGRGEVRSLITVPQIRVLLAEALAPAFSTGPLFILFDPADRLGESAANALLKTLEEPPRRVHFILITSRPNALLPTVVSRCVRYRFGLLSNDDVVRAVEQARGSRHAAPPVISEERPGVGRSRARRGAGVDVPLVSALSGGRVGRALQLAAGPALDTHREIRSLLLDLFEALARGLPAGTFVVLAGASIRAREREEWLQAIGILELLLRDLAVLSVDAGAGIVNTDVRERLLRLAVPLGARCARALSLLDSVRSDFRFNVNARLATERIFIEVARDGALRSAPSGLTGLDA